MPSSKEEKCMFYLKTNGCRYGSECTKTHIIPSNSRIVVVKNMYLYPKNDSTSTLSVNALQIHFDLFYEDWFSEVSIEYGPVKKLVIASNRCTHLQGNIYIEFFEEQSAFKCTRAISKRYYCGKRIASELGCSDRISDGICAEYNRGCCSKEDLCGFIHAKNPSSDLERELFDAQNLLYTQKEYQNMASQEHNKHTTYIEDNKMHNSRYPNEYNQDNYSRNTQDESTKRIKYNINRGYNRNKEMQHNQRSHRY
ncbi:hypothetical protein CWI42_021780 [Ordospora colligata]|uniref:C3H1-type domain-containing protein n=1 Tax=Ordospora colligata OC4 TaxID=1354746 RepID=A0A0B2UM58_9MICR|nr:uncharacterized protein M896_021790 [Ordospora colligata OC4]KHN70339.1 hypothetical protein M896_021790 [Ordospora colligata OC4]TBU16883.1 hypothetical protein CWI41_021800 [Ordospora colligata]TBU16991.1 hypothetical protein CWI40_021800 [Ordospora colligata]TBU19432.1 hypothetical protein CWI42_021780 [Ordospora colligata]